MSGILKPRIASRLSIGDNVNGRKRVRKTKPKG
jgi:hypothetical protein